MSKGPLAGLQVVELSAFVAVPLAGATLAGLGADVIRVDPVAGGIDIDRAPTWQGVSLYWAGLNAGKRSAGIDMRRPDGQELVKKLAARAGNVITNLGVRGWNSYESLREARPDLVMVVLSGAVDGSPAVDYTVNAGLGFPYVTGPEGHDGPVNHVLPAWDGMAGLTVATALLAADRHRRDSGEGQLVELALQDVGLAFTAQLGIFSEARLVPEPRGRYGNFVFGTFGKDFRTRDGKDLILLALTPAQWRALVKATGIEFEDLDGELEADESARWRHRHAIAGRLQAWAGERTLAECAARLDEQRALWRPFNTFKEAAAEPPANRVLADVEHPRIGRLAGARSPLAFGAFPDQPVPQPPVLGQHTREVLSELGLTAGEIARLEREGVIGGAAARA